MKIFWLLMIITHVFTFRALFSASSSLVCISFTCASTSFLSRSSSMAISCGVNVHWGTLSTSVQCLFFFPSGSLLVLLQSISWENMLSGTGGLSSCSVRDSLIWTLFPIQHLACPTRSALSWGSIPQPCRAGPTYSALSSSSSGHATMQN